MPTKAEIEAENSVLKEALTQRDFQDTLNETQLSYLKVRAESWGQSLTVNAKNDLTITLYCDEYKGYNVVAQWDDGRAVVKNISSPDEARQAMADIGHE
jgi:hypothetical protein